MSVLNQREEGREKKCLSSTEGHTRNLHETAGNKERGKVKKEKKLVNNRRMWKGRKKLKVDLGVKWGKAKKESRRKEKNDPLKVRPSSLFMSFRWGSNATARLISLSI
jgi:hypothetical protein